MQHINDAIRHLHVGLPADIRRREAMGDFEGAIRLIDRHLQEDRLPEPLKNSLIAQRERIDRLELDYPHSRTDALAILRKHIPDFAESEFDELVDAGRIGWLCVRGEIRYIECFFDTLIKTEPAIAARAGLNADGSPAAVPSAAPADLRDYCARRMKEAGSLACRIRIRASIQLRDEHFTPGMFLRVHLPIPAACEQQSDICIEEVCPAGGSLDREDAEQRTVCWEGCFDENPEFSVVYSYVHTARYTDTAALHPADTQPDFATEEQPPHILFTPYIRELTAAVTEGASHSLEKARRIYDFITGNMKYSFMPAYFSLENIAESCARNFTGDCGVFALLFITMCRCAGIPAEWQSGLAAEPAFCGSHDWARFYIAPYGWLYADVSYGTGAARMGNESRRQFYFGNLDPHRMVANRAFQAPLTPDKTHWRADPYDNQVGEIESSHRGFRTREFIAAQQILLHEEL